MDKIDGYEIQKTVSIQTTEQDAAFLYQRKEIPEHMSDVNYYKINEDAARRAKEMNSFSDYKAGSATAGYRQMVDKAAGIAAAQKRRVYPMNEDMRQQVSPDMSVRGIQNIKETPETFSSLQELSI